MGRGWATSKLGSEVSVGRRPQSRVDIAKAVSGNLALNRAVKPFPIRSNSPCSGSKP